MKKIFYLLIFILTSTSVFSQVPKTETEQLTKLLGANKIELVNSFVDLPQDNKFWELFDEYEKQRESFGNKRYNLLVQYAENYESHNDKKLEEIIANSIKLRNDAEQLLLSYYEKIKVECGVKTASQFYFIQRFFESSLNANILGNLPIIDK